MRAWIAGIGALVLLVGADALAAECKLYCAGQELCRRPIVQVKPESAQVFDEPGGHPIGSVLKGLTMIVEERCGEWLRIETDYWSGGSPGAGKLISVSGWIQGRYVKDV